MKANRTVVGVDTAKRVFQLHWVELETGELVDLRLTRAKFLEHFANARVEACGGAQHWARSLRELEGATGDRRTMCRNWTAVQQPVKTVAVRFWRCIACGSSW